MQSCCSPFASASAAALRWRPLQLLLSCSPCLRPLQISCYSPIASASAAAPRSCPLQLLLARLRLLRLLLSAFACSRPTGFQPMPGCRAPDVLEHCPRSSRFRSTKVVRHYSSPAPRTSHFRHAHTLKS